VENRVWSLEELVERKRAGESDYPCNRIVSTSGYGSSLCPPHSLATLLARGRDWAVHRDRDAGGSRPILAHHDLALGEATVCHPSFLKLGHFRRRALSQFDLSPEVLDRSY
jgi:hypothetical protein